jgi:hypothetical protein
MYLNDETQKISWNTILEALTDPNKVLNFPIKYPALEFDDKTKQMFYTTASIIAIGMIASAYINKK